MPELPDVVVYVESLERRIAGQRLERVRLISPFVLRTVVPPLAAAEGRRVDAVRRLGKRIVICLEAELFLVLHLMIAGRLRWLERGKKLPARITLASFEFATGTVALTDPRLFIGIGNAYSDEILHRARLSPIALTQKLSPEESARLHRAAREVLAEWTVRLRAETGEDFPAGVTAFRPEMAVHGKFRQPCPVCGAPVQRIVYAENETNYCARCQTGGMILADRALARLLKSSWPRSIDEFG